METKSFSIDIIPDIATSASSAETYQRGVRSSVSSMDSLSPRMSWRNEAGSDLVIQMMRRSWRATCVNGYRLCSMLVTARTSMHFVTHRTGSRRHESDWCLTFADNISLDSPKRNHRQDEGGPTHRERSSMVSVLRWLKVCYRIKVCDRMSSGPFFCELKSIGPCSA